MLSSLPIVLLIVAAMPEASTAERNPDAVTVFHCDFGETWDVNYDEFPDHWTRAEGREYPLYLKVKISEEPSPVGDRCLRIQLDGGAAAIYSPAVPVNPQFSYVVEGYLKTEQLVHDVAYFSVRFLDEAREPLSTHTSAAIRDANDWRRVRVGPLVPPNQKARFAVVGLHLRPTDRADLQGAALFDDVWLARVPEMTLRSNSPHNVYSSADPVEIECGVLGITERDPKLRFELIDVEDHVVDACETRLEAEPQLPASGGATNPSTLTDASLPRAWEPAHDKAYVGSVTWKPKIPRNGYYRVRVVMRGRGSATHQETLSLAVVQGTSVPTGGEFGWSLPHGEQPLEIRSLVGLLTQVGINWVKFPVWFSDKDQQQADRLAWFAERLSSDQIELVGMLDQPPADARKRFGDGERLPAAAIFSDPEVWHPVLDPVMTRLSLKVRWWQLGRDGDNSYVGYPHLEEKIGEVKSHLRRFGQSIRLGIGWQWLNETSALAPEPWDFLSLSESPPLTDAELRAYLAGDYYGQCERWVVLQPLARSQYDVQTRAHDLVIRMLAAKIAGAQRVFAPEPFSAEHGLMNEDGTPGELLLPWRTTALMISGTKRIGSMRLPEGSHNEILARGQETIMVVWNEHPVQERVYLGADVRQVDLWGRETVPGTDGRRQVISVGPLPTFITGLNPSIAKWRLSFAFREQQLSSIVGRPQEVSYQLKNFFPQGVSGTITIDTPAVWGTPPIPVRFKLGANEELAKSFQVTLRPDAGSGTHDVRVDFQVAADQNYEFSVYRSMDVGLGDISIELNARISRDGELIVEQRLINQSEQFVSFNCYLFAPKRRRLRHQVFDLARGTDKRTFIFSNGAELIGKRIWLRAEEIGGNRVLNYRLTVEP